jgi:NADP-dependent 3-hydroxy acid dehydrogenase YdfG
MAGVSGGAVVVITGGASGLGLATAKALTSRGERVALIDRDADAVHAAAQSLGAETLGVAADICDAEAVTDAIGQIVDRFGAIDVVMACAGISGWGPALLVDSAYWERTIETNVLGTWRTVKAALPHLVQSKGYLLIVASGMAASPGPASSAYAASKAAVESLGRSLRIELAHHGVDVGVLQLFGHADGRRDRTQPGCDARARCNASAGAPHLPDRQGSRCDCHRDRTPCTARNLPRVSSLGAAPTRLLWSPKRQGSNQGDAGSRTPRHRSPVLRTTPNWVTRQPAAGHLTGVSA